MRRLGARRSGALTVSRCTGRDQVLLRTSLRRRRNGEEPAASRRPTPQLHYAPPKVGQLGRTRQPRRWAQHPSEKWAPRPWMLARSTEWPPFHPRGSPLQPWAIPLRPRGVPPGLQARSGCRGGAPRVRHRTRGLQGASWSRSGRPPARTMVRPAAVRCRVLCPRVRRSMTLVLRLATQRLWTPGRGSCPCATGQSPVGRCPRSGQVELRLGPAWVRYRESATPETDPPSPFHRPVLVPGRPRARSSRLRVTLPRCRPCLRCPPTALPAAPTSPARVRLRLRGPQVGAFAAVPAWRGACSRTRPDVLPGPAVLHRVAE